MIIDLRKYGTELRFWLDAFEPFVDHSSKAALRRLLGELESGREDLPRFPWKAPKPIRSKVTSRYDGPDKQAHPVYITWQFESEFERAGTRKDPIWNLLHMVTRIRVLSEGTDEPDILHFHYDMKSRDQLGPHIHLQISEAYIQQSKNVALAVPRFPSAVLLPTDCLDLVLAEFFPNEWPREQANSVGLAALRAGQRNRAMNLVDALRKIWDDDPKVTPFTKTQNCFMPHVQLA